MAWIPQVLGLLEVWWCHIHDLRTSVILTYPIVTTVYLRALESYLNRPLGLFEHVELPPIYF